MHYLFLAIASSALISILMRLSERHVHSNMVMFTANYAVCLIISLLYTRGTRLFAFTDGMTWAAALGLVSGFLYLFSFILFQENIRLNGVILSSAAMKLGGVLIPVIGAVALFHDELGWVRLVGVVIAVAAVILVNMEKEDVDRDGKTHWLLFLLLGSGLTDMMANVYDKTGQAALKNHYLVFTFLVAMLMSLVTALIKREKAAPRDILYGLLIGVPNYYSSRFLLLALGRVPAVVAYPVFSIGTIIAITLAGTLVFRERLTSRKGWALLLILVALVLLNI